MKKQFEYNKISQNVFVSVDKEEAKAYSQKEAVALLAKHGVKSGRELKPEQHADFAREIAETIAGESLG